jgi:hypothetical protein
VPPERAPAFVVAAALLGHVLNRGCRSKAKQGAAIFSDWGRYAREVALPSLGSYCCRLGVNGVSMAGFGVPVTAYTVILVVSSHVPSGLFKHTPGGLGPTQAVDVIALHRYAAADRVKAFSVSQASVAMLWSIILGVAVMIWAFGFTQMRQLLRSALHRRRARSACDSADASGGRCDPRERHRPATSMRGSWSRTGRGALRDHPRARSLGVGPMWMGGSEPSE